MSLGKIPPSCITPLISHITIFFTPDERRSLQIAVPAEPAPFITTFKSVKFFFTTFNALIIPERTTTAVPCWSSWKTGISNLSFNFLSISKHLGADISSKFMPPNDGEILTIVSTISSTFLVSRTIGKASTSANSLNSTHFPSITGKEAKGPISPRPRTAVPSDITATLFHFLVYI